MAGSRDEVVAGSKDAKVAVTGFGMVRMRIFRASQDV